MPDMIKVTLKGDVVKEFSAGTTAAEVAASLGAGLYKAACAAAVDGHTVDLREPLTADCSLSILTFDDDAGRRAYRHTASHILAQAVKRLFPQVKLAIGPAIDNGFYYDFDTPNPFTSDDLNKLESEMQKIVKEELAISRRVLPRSEALSLFSDEPYKCELINELPEGEDISVYTQGEFTDLCAGPHLMTTGSVKAIKLTSCTGAYWRGDSTKKMLGRIYGTCFPKAAQLEEYLKAVEEAKKRDHNIIGRQLKYFTTAEPVGQGLPLLMPKGAKVIQILQRYVEDLEAERGYVLTKTPFMAKKELYQISGHWDHYKDGMFIMGDEEKDEEVFALRPMTCPFQFMIYQNDMHSYRDLPIRYGETSTLFRNESSGEMHGLIRVRQFTISEGHLIVTPEQLESEFRGVVELISFIMDKIGLSEDLTYRFSQWDPNNREKYIGSAEEWEAAQSTMRTILGNMNLKFTEAAGEAAFYGPKLDIQIKNVHGKEDTLITVQIDFSLAQRFDMTYVDADGSKKFPYVIHRTSVGCYERTLALLLEKYAGALPWWLSPVQVTVLPISEHTIAYAEGVYEKLKKRGIRAEIDRRSEKIGYKIREAQLNKYPYMLVVGEKEQEQGTVSVRCRKQGDLGSMSIEDFLKLED